MPLFDSHAHLLDQRFLEDRQFIIDNFDGLILNAGCDIDDSLLGITLAQANEKVYCSCGVHPHEAASAQEGYLNELSAMLRQEKVVALGEMGLDYHYDFSPRDVQRKVFAEQLELAKQEKKPAIFHMREATQDFLDIVKNVCVSGVMHCFSGSAQTAKACLDLGYFISFSGSLTFKNATKLLEAARVVPLDRLMAETDCPYLSPHPKRGERNEPKNVSLVVAKLAELHGKSYEEMQAITFENAKVLYGI